MNSFENQLFSWRSIAPKKGNALEIEVTDKFVEHVQFLGGLGLTDKQISQYFGCTHPSWLKLIKRYPHLLRVVAQGRMQKVAQASGKLWDAVEQGKPWAIKMFLFSVAHWRDSGAVVNEEIQKDSNSPLPAFTLQVNDPIEAAKIYQQIMLGS